MFTEGFLIVAVAQNTVSGPNQPGNQKALFLSGGITWLNW